MIARSSNGGDKMYRIPGLLYNNNNGHRNVSLPFIVNSAIVWFTLMQLTSFTWWTLAGSDMSNIVEIWHLHSFTIDLSSVVCMYVCGYVYMSLRLQSHRSTKCGIAPNTEDTTNKIIGSLLFLKLIEKLISHFIL